VFETASEGGADAIRIVLADDHPAILAGLRALIDGTDGMTVVAAANTGGQALRLIEEFAPGVAVVDIALPDMTGVVLARKAAALALPTRLIVLTAHNDRTLVQTAFEAGVRGYVLKGSPIDHVLHAVRAVMTEGFYLDPTIAGQLFDPRVAPGRRRASMDQGAMQLALTQRESEVIRLVALGHTNKEISGQINVTTKSIETYKMRACDKLGIRTRAQIVRYARLQGWLCEP
jgi:DNA-binding NarL/FixJ family response regulator